LMVRAGAGEPRWAQRKNDRERVLARRRGVI
jgi:hypothetical protein